MNKWEEFANANAEYYILTHENVDFNTQQGQDYFFKSGEEDTSKMLNKVFPLLKNKGKALEIGCGIGRLAFAHAKVFDEVTGVDVSETMLKKLGVLAQKHHISNVKTFIAGGSWDREKYYDYVYSYIVFQHIADFSIIEDYIRKIAGAIAETGIAQLHFDTRKPSVPYLLRNIIPDVLLPKSQRLGIRRNRRKAEELKSIFQRYGLKLVKEYNPDSADHFFILSKAN